MSSIVTPGDAPVHSDAAPRRRPGRPPAGPASTPAGAARREALLDAAEALLVERGLEGFRVREVAQWAGVHPASLLHYFPDREALLRGVVARTVAALDRVPVAGSAPDAPPPREGLCAHFRHVLGQLRAHPERFLALNELFLRAARDPAVRRVLAATEAGWEGYLVTLLETGAAAGAFRPGLDPRAAAAVVTACFKGLGLDLALARGAAGDPDGDACFERAARAVAQLERWITGDPDGAVS